MLDSVEMGLDEKGRIYYIYHVYDETYLNYSKG